MQSNPIGLDGGENSYLYANGNSLWFVDESGHSLVYYINDSGRNDILDDMITRGIQGATSYDSITEANANLELIGESATWLIGIGEIKSTYLAIGATKSGVKYFIYHGYDRDEVVRYVGITMREAEKRFAEHLKSIGTGKEFLNYKVVKVVYGKLEARIIEQKYINKYGLENLLNKINSIAKKYWKEHGIK